MNLQKKLVHIMLILGLLASPLVGCAGMDTAPSDEGAEFEMEITLEPVPSVAAPYKGRTVTVVSFPDKTIRASNWWRPWLGRASTDYLVEFLIEAGFRVVEGQSGELDELLKEVEFGQTGMVNASTAVKLGEMLGAELIFVGAVTDYKQVKTGGKKEFAFGGMGLGFGGESINYQVQASGRLVDIKTRETLASTSATYKNRRRVSGGSLQVGGIGYKSGEEMEIQAETSGRIFQKALNALTIKIVNRLNNRAAAAGGGA